MFVFQKIWRLECRFHHLLDIFLINLLIKEHYSIKRNIIWLPQKALPPLWIKTNFTYPPLLLHTTSQFVTQE